MGGGYFLFTAEKVFDERFIFDWKSADSVYSHVYSHVMLWGANALIN